MPDLTARRDLLDTTFFLYPSVEDAQRGTRFGGTGAIVGVPLKSRPDIDIRYAVSNWHVVCQQGASIIRLNKKGGGFHVIETDPTDWHFIPGGPDLAAMFLPRVDECKVAHFPTNYFIDHDCSDLVIGDDVFTVGRFVDYESKETNQPVLRFGAVSMLEAEVRQPTGYSGPSVIIDSRSRTGFSGSPVYAYRPGKEMTLGGNEPNNPHRYKGVTATWNRGGQIRRWGVGNFLNVRLVGIHWGQFKERWEVYTKQPDRPGTISSEAYIEGLSGMTCVVPASDIVKLLDEPRLADPRNHLDQSGDLSRFPAPE